MEGVNHRKKKKKSMELQKPRVSRGYQREKKWQKAHMQASNEETEVLGVTVNGWRPSW